MKNRKKLIEVALPLDAINEAAASEKSIYHGHPSTLHPWWARRPLAAARAVIFSQMVDDPSSYVDELLGDSKLKRKGESELKKKHKLWEEAVVLQKKAKDGGVDAPEPGPEPTLETVLADIERDRLFAVIKKLVIWENTTNEEVLEEARREIWQSWRRACADNADHPRAEELFDRNKLPSFHDPFAGGGALPLEAQRLGLESYASDLNPVAVLINKAMIEVPPKYAGKPPVNPDWQTKSNNEKAATTWQGAQGLAEDVRYYGQWMRDEAEKRIGHLYPKVEITSSMVKERPDLKPLLGKKLTVIAWLWARTVKSPNPAFREVDVPLVSTFMLSTKEGKKVYVDPVITKNGYRFTVNMGKPKNGENAINGTKVGRGGNFTCLMSGTPIPVEYIRRQGIAGMLGSKLMAIVAEGVRGRIYISPDTLSEEIAQSAKPIWKPELEINYNPRDIRTQLYGLMKYCDLFTPRQLVVLSTFSELVGEAMNRICKDIEDNSASDSKSPLSGAGYKNNDEYARAITMYLGLCLSKESMFLNTLSRWRSGEGKTAPAFGRQAIPMVWDYADINPFAGAGGDYGGIVEGCVRVISEMPSNVMGMSEQHDAQSQQLSSGKVISTDPPYYDNIGYADLSDYFYVWLRRSLKSVIPALFDTVAVPKVEELVATPYRHGNKDAAESFFLNGMTNAMHRLAELTHRAFPVTIYYAFKQSEREDDGGIASTGWETFLDAVIKAGFSITGTWPIRSENATRLVSADTNVLASSIVLVCRQRNGKETTATRREYIQELKSELPEALRALQAGNIAPVDLAQAAIGPGMAVFTRYSKVLDAQGRPISVRDALIQINAVLDEVLAEQEGDFDSDSRWALTWYEQHGFENAESGDADTLSKAKNTSIKGLVEAGILVSGHSKTRLLRPDELPSDWDPTTDARLTVWEIVHHLIRVLGTGGERAAAELVQKIGSRSEASRELAYRLYALCERKKRSDEAAAYNGLVQSWPEIVRLAQERESQGPSQESLFNNPKKEGR